MPKPHTHPRLFDSEALTLDIVDLNLKTSRSSLSGESIEVKIKTEVNGRLCEQRLTIVGVPKPFGGFQHYFVCPITGKRCSRLYRFENANSGRFAHREAFPSACYSIQTLSKSDRVFATKRRSEEALSRKGIKKSYKGKPTRRYAALSRRLQRAKKAEASIFISLVSRFSNA